MLSRLVSVPGKVLLTGGYVILNPRYGGLVATTSSRLKSLISATEPDTNSSNRGISSCRVVSPSYGVDQEFSISQSNETFSFSSSQKLLDNEFISNTLYFTLLFGGVTEFNPFTLDIDNHDEMKS